MGAELLLIHLTELLRNTHHQGVDCQTSILKGKLPKTTVAKTVSKSKPILHGLYHDYRKIA
jgi:hypothetical protein